MLNLPKFNQVAFAFATLLQADPAPGAGFAIITPGNQIISPITLYFTYIASAAVANRLPGFVINTGASTFYAFTALNPITAALTFSVVASTCPNYLFNPAPGFIISLPFPRDIFLYNPDLFNVGALNMDAADQITNISLHHKFWPI